MCKKDLNLIFLIIIVSAFTSLSFLVFGFLLPYYISHPTDIGVLKGIFIGFGYFILSTVLGFQIKKLISTRRHL